MSIEAVIFDIGGVLEVNPRTRWQERWAHRLHMDLDSFEQRLADIWAAGSVGQISLKEVERRVAIALELDRTTVSVLMDDVWSEYVGSLNEELAAYFTSLRPRYKTAMLSNSFVGAREREEQLYHFAEMCDVIVYSHEVGWRKPDPRIYRIVSDRLRVAPGAAVFLDDLQENVDGALAVSIHAILFRDNEQAVAEVVALLMD